MKYSGPPMTLSNAAAAPVRLIVWCRDCGRQREPDPAALVDRYGAETAVVLTIAARQAVAARDEHLPPHGTHAAVEPG
jgi:hypothetical protein